jgi:hypothetical protein
MEVSLWKGQTVSAVTNLKPPFHVAGFHFYTSTFLGWGPCPGVWSRAGPLPCLWHP